MWDDITIGSGDKLTSSIKCFDIDGNFNISENKVSYWISGLIFNKGITVFKDTAVGIHITALRDKKASSNKILKYLNKQVLSRLNVGDVLLEIEEIRRHSFDKGKEAMSKEFNNLLNYKSKFI